MAPFDCGWKSLQGFNLFADFFSRLFAKIQVGNFMAAEPRVLQCDLDLLHRSVYLTDGQKVFDPGQVQAFGIPGQTIEFSQFIPETAVLWL